MKKINIYKEDPILKVYFRGNTIYTREVKKITGEGFYNVDGYILAYGKRITDYEEWFSLIQAEIKSKKRNKIINQILK